MDYSKLAMELAAHIREAVRPLIGTVASRKVTGTASSGDATFSIDNVAEDAVEEFITRRGLEVVYYTEDAGLRTFGTPEAALIIDPIDGSRGAKAGFECCVISVAVAEYKPSVKMRDVVAGCVYELKDDAAFVAGRNLGVKVYRNGSEVVPVRSEVDHIEYAAWSAEIAGRPAALIMQIIGDAVDASSIRGGFFILNSTAFSLSRLVNGQLSAVVDVGGRLIKDYPVSRAGFERAGAGSIMGLFPYDFAAAALIAQEAGCVVTDGYGRALDDVNLFDSSEGNIQSIIAASTPALHAKFLDEVERGFARFLSD